MGSGATYKEGWHKLGGGVAGVVLPGVLVKQEFDDGSQINKKYLKKDSLEAREIQHQPNVVFKVASSDGNDKLIVEQTYLKRIDLELKKPENWEFRKFFPKYYYSADDDKGKKRAFMWDGSSTCMKYFLVLENVWGGITLEEMPSEHVSKLMGEYNVQENKIPHMNLFRDMINAAYFLDTIGIVNEDQNDKNILIDPNGIVKFIDFDNAGWKKVGGET